MKTMKNKKEMKKMKKIKIMKEEIRIMVTNDEKTQDKMANK